MTIPNPVDGGRVDIDRYKVVQGIDIGVVIAVKQETALGSNVFVPTNLTGWTLLFEVYTTFDPGGSKVIDKPSTSITFQNVDGTNDGARIAIVKIDTINADGSVKVPAGDYWYSLRRVDVNNNQRLAWGLFPLAADGWLGEVA